MAAMGPEDRAGAGTGCLLGRQEAVSATTCSSSGPDVQQTLAEKAFVDGGPRKSKTPGWSNLAAQRQSVAATATGEAPYSFRSPESVEMDEIMAAMVLTSLSCSPVVQSPHRQILDQLARHHLLTWRVEAASSPTAAAVATGAGTTATGAPAPSPSITEVDSSPDEGLQMELEQGEELTAKKPKSSFRSVYKCLWPSCGKVLTSSVGIKRHIRVLHLGSGSDQSQREEDFYYTKICCEAVEARSAAAPAQQPPGQASSAHPCWASCASPPCSELQIPLAPRPRSNSSSGPGPNRPSPLSQSAPSSFWQIHSEHLYQACSPVQVSAAPRSPCSQGATPSTSVSSHSNPPMVKPRCRSVSVGEQWLQQNRLQPMSASPSRTHCSFRKSRGEAKKCRKVYGVERKDQWCTACRWKKACQRFPD